MPRLFLPIFTVFIIFAGTASSANFQKGFTALKRGDYATALREKRPLAERGHPISESD